MGDIIGGIFGSAGQNQQAGDFMGRINSQNEGIQNALFGNVWNQSNAASSPWSLNAGQTNPWYTPGKGGQVGLFNQYDYGQNQAQDMASNAIGQYNSGAAGVRNQANQAIGTAQQFGRGANDLIDQQSARDLRGTNRSSLGQLAQSGLANSTLASNQLAGNSLASSLANRQQKLGIQQQQAGMTMGAQQNAANVGNSLLQGQAGLNQGATNLYNSNNQNALNTKLGFLTNSSQTPWTNATLNSNSTGNNNNSNLAGVFGSTTGQAGLGALASLFGF
jgi:hypothetical protein